MASTEFELIGRYFTGLDRGAGVVLGLGDDAALVDSGGGLALCLDTLVEGVHFPVGAPADAVGYKALAVNLSDLAAMGAEPLWVLLGLTLPEADDAWVGGFARGFRALAERWDVRLIGGDTTRGPRSVTVQLAGRVAPEAALRRSGARVGDDIYISGWPGEAALGLRQWQAGIRHGRCLDRLHRPIPRIDLGLALRGVASAAIDVSDGVLADLTHVAAASGVGADVVLERLPLSDALRAETPTEDAQALALTGGDDYELCFTAPAAAASQVEALSNRLALPLTRIGRVTAGPAVRVLRDGAPVHLARSGYRHFTSDGEHDET